eukprot:g19766.t1
MVQMAPRRTAGWLLGLLAVVASFQTSIGQTSEVLESCPAEAIACAADEVCLSCLESLQAAGISLELQIEGAECSEIYAGLCVAVEGVGCDVTNSNLEALAGCISEEQLGCPAFVSCAKSTETFSPTPTPVITEAPTEVPAAMVSMAPSSMEDAEDTNAADQDSGVPRTVAAAAARTAMAFACGLALFLSV